MIIESFTDLLHAVLTGATPIVASVIIWILTLAFNHLKTHVLSNTSQKYIDQAADAVTTAVHFISQSYVDDLKRDGTFTEENQKIAFNKALTQAKLLLTQKAKDFLHEAYGDLTDYLSTKIEAEVHLQNNT
jgi:hypothetical protein